MKLILLLALSVASHLGGNWHPLAICGSPAEFKQLHKQKLSTLVATTAYHASTSLL
jgi:hypothetical protein